MKLSIEFTEDEARDFESRALAAGLTASAYLKALATGGTGTVSLPAQQPQQRRSFLDALNSRFAEWATERTCILWKKFKELD